MESTTCPNCQKAIRLPDDVLGQRAQCPFCKCHFRAPVRTAAGTLAAPQLIGRNPFAESRTFGPGAALLFVGLLGMVFNAVRIGQAYADPETFERQTRELFEARGWDGAERTIRWLPIARIGFLALSGLVAAGGVAALRQRWHGLAMLGSVGALFLVSDCCCVLGFPAGGWALFVLRDPTVQAQFQRPPTTPAPPG